MKKNFSKNPVQGTEEPAQKPEVKTALILMAIFESAAFTKLRKSFGNLTTCEHKGQNIVKQKVEKVTNPNTESQQMQRKKFPTLVDLSVKFSPAIAVGLKNAKKTKHTVENYFVHVNKGNLTVDHGLVVSIDFERLILSKGNRAVQEEVSATLDTESRTLTLAFESAEEGVFVAHAAGDDVFYCCVVEKTLLQVKVVQLGMRAELADSANAVALPGKWEASADNLGVYLFCTDARGTASSRTVCLTVG